MNAFSKIFEYGAPEAFQQGRDKRLTRDLGNALADGNYSGAADMALRGGQLETGLKLRGEAETRQQEQTAEQRKAEAQGTYQLFNSMQPAQINDYAMQDPVGFERRTGMSSEEYLQSAKQMQQYGMTLDQFRQFVIQKAQAELGMEAQTAEPYTLAPGARRFDAQGNEIAANPVAEKPMGPNSDIGRLAADLQAGLITQQQFDTAFARMNAPRAPLVSVNTGDKQESAFATEAGKIEAQNFGSLVEMGQTAGRNRVILDQLDASSASVPGGLEAVAKTTLGNLGIETAGLTELQATEALINQLVPAQRQPGSGPMSDKDLALFKQSLPRLIQTPEGRAKIIENMKAINDYVAQEGRIASDVLSGRIPPEEGRNRMEALGNPLSEYAGGGSDLPPGFVILD
jgi:flagellar protein FlgJ